MRKTAEFEFQETDLARDMLATGVVIADFESRFEREGGLVSNEFHTEWETVIAKWWELATRYEVLKDQRGIIKNDTDYMASIARISKLP